MALPFVFAVPLVPRSLAADWGRVCRRLEQTVGSALAAAGPDTWVAIAYHDRPEGVFWSDPRVVGLAVDYGSLGDLERVNADKDLKRRTVGAWVRAQLGEAVIMGLDGDDLVHRGLVARIRASGHDGGFRIVSGLKVVQGPGVVAAELVTEGFHLSSGTCFAARFRRSDLPRDVADAKGFMTRTFRREHREYGDRYTRLTGRAVRDLDFPAAAYLIDLVESTHHRRRRARLGTWATRSTTLYALAWALRHRLRPRPGPSNAACMRLLQAEFLPPGARLV